MHRRFTRSSIMTAFTAVALVGITAALPGCLGGCDLRPITRTFGFVQDVTIGQNTQQLADLAEGESFTGVEIPLGTGDEECQIEGENGLDTIMNLAQFSVVRSIVKIDKVTVDSLTLSVDGASEGDFSFLDSLSIRIVATGASGGPQTFTLSTAAGADLSQEVVLTPVGNELDLWGLLQDGVTCIRGTLIISGRVPADPVTFDGELQITIQPVISLRR